MDQRPKTKNVCTLGPASRSVPLVKKLPRAGMNVARFNFSHESHEYHQETLNNLRAAMESTGILCAVMLDIKGPEIRTGFLKDEKPVQLNSKTKKSGGYGFDTDAPKALFPFEFPYGGAFGVSSDFSSPVESSETESDEEDYLVGLTRQMARSTLDDEFKYSDSAFAFEKPKDIGILVVNCSLFKSDAVAFRHDS